MANRKRRKDEDEPAIKLYAGTGDSEDYEPSEKEDEETPHGIPHKMYAEYKKGKEK